jgi:hypothetical protein
MSDVSITAPGLSHMLSVVRSLAQSGWVLVAAPEAARLIRNGQLFVLRTSKQEARLRVFVYKITGSSRDRPDERRIEITSTYQKGLPLQRDYQDVVLGIDANHNIFVGVDPRRIGYGGATGNASSFFDRDGLDWGKENEILVRPRSARLFPNGLEYHAFFKPTRLAEYLLNIQEIHVGSYTGYGAYSVTSRKLDQANIRLSVPSASAIGSRIVFKGPSIKPTLHRVSNRLVDAYENGEASVLRRAKLSPERLLDIKRRCEENGYIGEEFVLNYERRRLRRNGRGELASRVSWVSQLSAAAGFDISSFEEDGTERWIEVKSTAGNGQVFEISENEWRTAGRAGEKYYIYRVTNVRTDPRIIILANPHDLERRGLIQKTPAGYWVTIGRE